MSFEKRTKTEHGHRKDMAGKAWNGRDYVKFIISRLRRIQEKKMIEKEVKEHKSFEEFQDEVTGGNCVKCGTPLRRKDVYIEHCNKCGKETFI